MPTPSTEDLPPPPLHQLFASVLHRSLHATCPPDDDRAIARSQRLAVITPDGQVAVSGDSDVSSHDGDLSASTDERPSPSSTQDSDGDSDTLTDASTPVSAIDEPRKRSARSTSTASPSPAITPFTPTLHSPDFPSIRPVPKYSSSFLRPGSKFEGTQQSDRQVYNVQVEIKHVDMSESFVCGYLHIERLTADHPTLTTYFEGEIIGNKYSFLTAHAEWGSNEKIDMQHWNRFPAWRPLQRQARKADFHYKNYAEREHLFMRWKEYFLVPDHKVRAISGASFEGFYYICFNQVSGTVSGIYFHSKSEKFQQLELKHVEDHGCMGAMEFR